VLGMQCQWLKEIDGRALVQDGKGLGMVNAALREHSSF